MWRLSYERIYLKNEPSQVEDWPQTKAYGHLTGEHL